MIDWQAVEVGDVVEWRNGERMKLPPREMDQWNVFHEDGKPILRFGYTCYDGDEILAIHKRGTVGALSHEERSRLWDKMEEYSFDLVQWNDGGWYAVTKRHVIDDSRGKTPLEAVAKCVAAIEKENTNG